MKRILALVTLVLLIQACKTTEELQREQMVDNLSIQMAQNQKLSAEAQIKIQNLEERINNINGTLEETGHKVDTTYSNQMKENQQKLELLQKVIDDSTLRERKLSERVGNLEKELAEQKKYIKQVLSVLNKVNSTVEDNKKRSPYQEAFYNFNKGKNKLALPQLESLLESKKIKGKRRARVLNALGMLNYWSRKDDQAIVYLSKLFTEHPKAPYTTNGLIYMAKAFKRKGEKEQAISALEMLIQKYPSSKKISQAKKLLKQYRK